jgi:NTE family protein
VKLKTVIPAVDINRNKTIVFTNRVPMVKQSDTVYWQSGVLLSEAMRASIAVPTVFRPKQLGSLYLVDGGVTDVLPVNLLQAAENQMSLP